jgi:hypothetical protein
MEKRKQAMDKVTAILLEALRQGASLGGEQRLYRSGKLPGLFAGRTSLHAEVASQAVRDGLLEIIRTETKGKTTIEWVKVTPRGTAFLLEHESPLHPLEELKAVLQTNQDGLPAWLADMRSSLDMLTRKVTEEIAAMSRRLDDLAGRVAESLKRADKLGPQLPAGAATALPWAHDAVGYLEKRQASGLPERCALSELFAAVKDKEDGLTVKDFHVGLRRLHDRGVLRLLPFEGPEGPPEPEYALLDGAAMYYFAAR